MLTYVLPLLVYLLSFPVMLITLFRVEVGILFFSLFVPVIALMKKIAGFPQGNNFADFLLTCMIVGWLVRSQKKNRKMFKPSRLNMALFLTFFGSLVALAWGFLMTPLPADVDTVRIVTWKNYILLPIMTCVVMNNLEDEETIKLLLMGVCITMIAMDFNFHSTFRWIKSYHFSDSMRISGAFTGLGPNEMGIFFAMYTCLLLGVVYYTSEKWLTVLMLFACSLNLYPIIYSYSRGTYGAFLSGLMVIGLLKDRRILLLILMIILCYRMILPNSVIERIDMTFLGEEELYDGSKTSSALDVGGVTLDTVGRVELWDAAKSHFFDNPLMGIGFDTFRHVHGMITHNLFLRVMAEQGLIGFAILLFFTVTALGQAFTLFRKGSTQLGKGIGLGFLACIIVDLVGNISSDQALYYHLMSIYWVFLGVVGSYNASSSKLDPVSA